MSQESGFEITFANCPAGLHAHVRGASTLQNTLAYWQRIVEEVHRRQSRAILLIDELEGEPLGEADWRNLVQAMLGTGVERLRIAHVKPLGLQQIEFCELYAVEAGINARVFADETEADLWLRHGME